MFISLLSFVMARKHEADVIMSSCHSDIIMSSPVFIQMSI